MKSTYLSTIPIKIAAVAATPLNIHTQAMATFSAVFCVIGIRHAAYRIIMTANPVKHVLPATIMILTYEDSL